MKNRIVKVSIALLILLSAILLTYCKKQDNTANQPGTATPSTTADTVAGGQDMVQRGDYLVTILGCNDCHTPKIWGNKPIPDLDTTRLLSGHRADKTMSAVGKNCLTMEGWAVATNADFTAWTGPWGTSFTANLTPDEATGLGGWDENTFIQAIRNGKHMGTGRDILPPMPWPGFAKMTDNDLRAVFAYLHSLKPVNNQVPQPVPPKGGPSGAPGGTPTKGTGGTGVGG